MDFAANIEKVREVRIVQFSVRTFIETFVSFSAAGTGAL